MLIIPSSALAVTLNQSNFLKHKGEKIYQLDDVMAAITRKLKLTDSNDSSAFSSYCK